MINKVTKVTLYEIEDKTIKVKELFSYLTIKWFLDANIPFKLTKVSFLKFQMKQLDLSNEKTNNSDYYFYLLKCIWSEENKF